MMKPFELAQARHNAYQLFSELFLHGVTESLLPYVAAVPELRETLPDPLVLDEAAAEHHQVLSLNLFPYESVFLDPEGILEGPITQQLLADYLDMGFGQVMNDVSADHIGHELAALAFLCGAEADAEQDELPARAAQIRTRQLQFLNGHLLRWWAPFATAVETEGRPFYSRLTELTNDLLRSHCDALTASVVHAPAAFELPKPPDLLGSDKTSLKDIAQFLVTAPYSGLFLSREAIGQLARRHELPRGFGSREQILANLFRAAVQYEALSAVLTDLQTLFSEVQADHDSDQVWQARASETAALLDRMQDEIDALQTEE